MAFFGCDLRTWGRPDAAVTTATQSVEMLRTLSKTDGGQLEGLARALENLYLALMMCEGREEDIVRVFRELEDVYTRACAIDPGSLRPRLSRRF